MPRPLIGITGDCDGNGPSLEADRPPPEAPLRAGPATAPLPYEQFVALRDNIAVNGVLVPILVDGDGPVRSIIDGNYRQRIAEELGYECPVIVKEGLTDEEKRTLARCLNLARRELNQQQRRQLIADHLRETPERSNRLLAKQLGVHHATVASVRSSLGGLVRLSSWSGPSVPTGSPVLRPGNPHRCPTAPTGRPVVRAAP